MLTDSSNLMDMGPQTLADFLDSTSHDISRNQQRLISEAAAREVWRLVAVQS